MLVRDIKSNKKLIFHYFLLASDYTIEQLGALVEKDLGDDFSLFQTNDNNSWNPFVLLFWTETPLQGAPSTLLSLFHNNEHIALWEDQRYCLLNNGEYLYFCPDMNCRQGLTGLGYFVIAHNYKDGEYTYRFGAGFTACGAVATLCGADNTIKEGTVIDYIFFARPNVQNKYFVPINFKVRESYWNDSYGHIFLTDVKGVYDLKKIKPKVYGELGLIKLLPDKMKPETLSQIQNITIEYYICYPEEKISITAEGVDYKDSPALAPLLNMRSNIKRVIVPKKKELREKLLGLAIENTQEEMEMCYFGEAIAKTDAVKMFLGNAKKQKNERQLHDKTYLENYYGSLVADRRRSIERRDLIKERTKSFIPIPHILIPQHTEGFSICDLSLYIHKRNNKYYFDREEVNIQ